MRRLEPEVHCVHWLFPLCRATTGLPWLSEMGEGWELNNVPLPPTVNHCREVVLLSPAPGLPGHFAGGYVVAVAGRGWGRTSRKRVVRSVGSSA